MIGAVRNSYVRKNSIHHTYNRAVAIHGVHYLRVQDNVAFETMGALPTLLSPASPASPADICLASCTG